MKRNITDFYEINFLKDSLIKLAALNIILCKEEWSRYHTYTKDWSEHVDLAKIDNGSGDHMFIFFSSKGAVIKGFDHESLISPHAGKEFKIWDGMYTDLPSHFEDLLKDPSIEMDVATFCLWRESQDSSWIRGNVIFENGEDDGSGFLLGTIYNKASDFKAWADDYFEVNLSATLISNIYNKAPITDELILGLNNSCNLNDVKNELKILGLVT